MKALFVFLIKFNTTWLQYSINFRINSTLYEFCSPFFLELKVETKVEKENTE